MIVLITQKVRVSLRGRLTRWLIQPQSGVYVGHLSGRVRDRLWAMVRDEIDINGGSAILIHPTANEQGYRISSHGDTPKETRDFDGLTLPKKPEKRR